MAKLKKRKNRYKVGDVLEVLAPFSIGKINLERPDEWFSHLESRELEPGEKLLVKAVRIPGEQFKVSLWGVDYWLIIQSGNYQEAHCRSASIHKVPRAGPAVATFQSNAAEGGKE